MIQETCVEIDEIQGRALAERAARTARRNRLRYIDGLLEEFELLNLADESRIPIELEGRVSRLLHMERHPVAYRPVEDVCIVDWMDALYDVEDTLMFSSGDDED